MADLEDNLPVRHRDVHDVRRLREHVALPRAPVAGVGVEALGAALERLADVPDQHRRLEAPHPRPRRAQVTDLERPGSATTGFRQRSALNVTKIHITIATECYH